jgi:hypothetical protein
MRQMVYKVTGWDVRKWYWFLPQIVWVDRITTWQGLGSLPYFTAMGCHPIIPLDIVESTWLMDYPGEIITTAELVGLRARAIVKHRQHVKEMHERVDTEKLEAVKCFEREHENTIKDYDLTPGSLVLIRNTRVEKSLKAKLEPKYLGPMVMVRRTFGLLHCLQVEQGRVSGEGGGIQDHPLFCTKGNQT